MLCFVLCFVPTPLECLLSLEYVAKYRVVLSRKCKIVATTDARAAWAMRLAHGAVEKSWLPHLIIGMGTDVHHQRDASPYCIMLQ